jgi:hypothetical protein
VIPDNLKDPKTLGEKQRLFAFLVSLLIQKIYGSGYAVSFGDAFDTDGDGGHMAGTVHNLRLAVDLNLFLGSDFKATSEAHKPFGEYWESLHPLCRWGGRFKKPDGNHYSLTHGGKA